MIQIDTRAGSNALIPYFRPYDVEIQPTVLEFGDLAFSGEGKECGVAVGIEHKSPHDLVNSMRSNRLSGHQLPGLMDMYDYVFLCVEGPWRCGGRGELEVLAGKGWVPMSTGGSRPILYREVSSYLTTLELKCGVDVIRTVNAQETAAWVVGLYHWFQKPWGKHDAWEAIYKPDIGDNQRSRRGSLVRRVVGPVGLVAADFPGVSKKAWEFEKVFRTVEDMVNADTKRLQKVEGVGKKGAELIWKWLRGQA